MEHTVTTNWREEEIFDVRVNEHSFIIDGNKQLSTSPKPLLLVSLGGCTGIDVVDMLKKMRVSFERVDVKVTGHLRDEHPKYYDRIEVLYRITGTNIDHSKVERAVTLSKDKYCGVSAMLGKVADIDYRIEYVDPGVNAHE